MAIVLPKLPYELNALEPHLSREALEFHYGKHHKAYVDKTNKLIAGTEYEGRGLEKIIAKATGELFNNAAQVWNHNFYWNCLTPEEPPIAGELDEALVRAFGDSEMFEKKFTEAAVGLFGSGWTWLVKDPDGSLHIVTTKDGDTPLTEGQQPLLTCDVWEHAYYIDYRNDRAQYLQHFWPLVNWEFVARNLGARIPEARGKPRHASLIPKLH